MLRSNIVFSGTKWIVKKTVSLYELIIEENGEIEAPEGQYLTMTVNGVGTSAAPGHYQGDIVLTVSDNYLMAPHGLMKVNGITRNFHQAALIVDNKVAESKGVPAVLQGGSVTGTEANGVYVASTEESFNGFVITGDSKYAINNCEFNLEGFGANDFLGVGTAVTAIDNADVTINDSKFILNGVTRCAVHVGGDSTVHVNNCHIENRSPDSDWLGSFSWAVGFQGTNRLNQLTDNGTVYYNNCTMKTNGWGVLSIDGSDDGVKMFAKDCDIELTGARAHGYGMFCIGENQCVFDRCRVNVNGYPMLVMGMGGLGRAGIINGSEISGRRFGAMVIGDDNSVFDMSDSSFKTGKSTLVVKASSTVINIDNCSMEPSNGTILQLMDTDESGMNIDDYKIPVGVADVPAPGRDLTVVSPTEDVILNLSNMTLKGNFYNSTTNILAYRLGQKGGMGKFHDALIGFMDAFDNDAPERPSPAAMRHNGNDLKGPKNLLLDMKNVRVEGVISSASQAYREGLNRITELNRDELSNITQAAAPPVNNGVVVKLDKDSAWTVAGTSYVTGLTIAEGAKVEAAGGAKLVMKVNGKQTPAAPGVYTGVISLELA